MVLFKKHDWTLSTLPLCTGAATKTGYRNESSGTFTEIVNRPVREEDKNINKLQWYMMVEMQGYIHSIYHSLWSGPKREGKNLQEKELLEELF